MKEAGPGKGALFSWFEIKERWKVQGRDERQGKETLEDAVNG